MVLIYDIIQFLWKMLLQHFHYNFKLVLAKLCENHYKWYANTIINVSTRKVADLRLHLVLRSRMHGDTPPPQYAFMVWCSVKAQGQLYYLTMLTSLYSNTFCGLSHGTSFHTAFLYSLHKIKCIFFEIAISYTAYALNTEGFSKWWMKEGWMNVDGL